MDIPPEKKKELIKQKIIERKKREIDLKIQLMQKKKAASNAKKKGKHGTNRQREIVTISSIYSKEYG